jgi:periplasmic divalent cation tolerance protein
MSSKFCFIYVTCKDVAEAEEISSNLLERKLIACANIGPEITSIYEWQGKLEKSQEVRLILKTTEEKFTQIEEEIKKIHSYETPCIVQFNVTGGNKEFLDWIENSVD